ncbi:MAG: alkaline phosphatase D family protein [Planctomycetota bacterium]
MNAVLVLLSLLAISSAPAPEPEPSAPPRLTVAPVQVPGKVPALLGPYLGHVGPREATLFLRATGDVFGPELVPVSVVDGEGMSVAQAEVVRNLPQDMTLRYDATGLQPDTTYAFAVFKERCFFKTPREPERPARVTLALGSCANDKHGLPNPVYKAILDAKPTALVLIGDTPYIDSTKLDEQRRRYKEFFANPDLSAIMKTTPTYAIWDDHDFAIDGADGRAEGKAASRQAFLEYHGNPSAGYGGEGIFTRFRRGGVDVFLLDTRWFSQTEKSFADPEKPTLLGKLQWGWLQRELAASTAPFKLLVSGMIWNDAVRPGKTDCWAAYPHERAAVLKLVAEKKIPGVILVGGDIHRSRAFLHPKEDTGVPYPIHEWITSPLGDNPMEQAAVPHKALTWDRGEKHSFLLIKADTTVEPPKLTARWMNAAGEELHKIELTSKDLDP